MGASGRHVERDNKPGRLLWPPVPVGGAVTDFTIIRSRRRTMALQISRDGLVVVRAPQLLAEEEIYRFVAEHEDWIRRNRQKQADRESAALCRRMKFPPCANRPCKSFRRWWKDGLASWG